MKHLEVEMTTDELRGLPAMPLTFKILLGGGRDPFAGVLRIDTVDFYTVDQVAKILHARRAKVRELAHRREDPIPFAVVGSCSVPLVSKSDLAQWFTRNSVPIGEKRQA